MKLYYSSASPFARKPRILAREAGIADKVQEVAITVSPVEKVAALEGANPLAKVPTLALDDGRALFDSPVICEYLDSLHGGRKLFPASGDARWTALKLQAIGDGILDAAILIRYETFVRPKDKQWDGWIQGQRNKWTAGLDLLEREAASLAGDLTIGGITVACVLGWLDFRYADTNWRGGRPHLAAWFEGVAKRASMQATMPNA